MDDAWRCDCIDSACPSLTARWLARVRLLLVPSLTIRPCADEQRGGLAVQRDKSGSGGLQEDTGCAVGR